MLYQILLRKIVEKTLENLPKKDATKIALAINSLQDDPFLCNRLEGELLGFYSLRVWPYRIIYEIKKKELIIFIIKIGHRKDIYK